MEAVRRTFLAHSTMATVAKVENKIDKELLRDDIIDSLICIFISIPGETSQTFQITVAFFFFIHYCFVDFKQIVIMHFVRLSFYLNLNLDFSCYY